MRRTGYLFAGILAAGILSSPLNAFAESAATLSTIRPGTGTSVPPHTRPTTTSTVPRTPLTAGPSTDSSFSSTNGGRILVLNGTNGAPAFVEEIAAGEGEKKDNIIFDSYDEMVMKNYDDQDVLEVHFSGNVAIRFDENSIKARKIIVTIKNGKVIELAAFDNVIFKMNGTIYVCDSVSFDPNSRRGVLLNVRSYMTGDLASVASSTTGWYYRAEKAVILSDSKIVLKNVFFTTSDERYPHWGIYASRLWYFKEEVVLAMAITYKVGEADFLWFPFFLQWEKMTGLQTAFGQEKRIGWYVMNTGDFTLNNGSVEVYFDFYERLGEYVMAHYKNKKPIGIIQNFDLTVEAADDVRFVKDDVYDRYSLFIDPYGNGDYQTIRQFSWHYKLNTTIAHPSGAYSLSILWEDLNDPYFLSKYNNRQTTFDIQKAIQPDNNYFYTYSGDETQPNKTFNRSFSFSAGALRVGGTWNYIQKVNPAVTNIYENGRYDYVVRSVSFPSISYSPATLTLISNISRSKALTLTVKISNTNYTLPLGSNAMAFVSNYVIAHSPSFTNRAPVLVYGTNLTTRVTAVTNRRVVKFTTNSVTNVSVRTNVPAPPPLPAFKISTNNYTYFTFKSTVDSSINYSSTETLDTNGNATSDQYSHTESIRGAFNMGLLNNLFSFNNSLNLNNNKQWSTFSANSNNNVQLSGAKMTLASGLGFNQTGKLWQNTKLETKFPLSLSHSINYELYNTTYSSKPRESTHNTSLSTGFNLLSQQIAFTLSGGHSIKYRMTNDGAIQDQYLDNILSRSLRSSATFKLFWLSLSSSASMNILDYRTITAYTNINGTNEIYSAKTNTMDWSVGGITNRMISAGSYPKLALSLGTKWVDIFPDAGKYIPNLNFAYNYDILKKTNDNYSLSTSYSLTHVKLPVFYELESLNATASFNFDYLTPRSSKFSLAYSFTVDLTKTWTLTFSTSVQNTKIYLYFQKYQDIYAEGETYTPFWSNLVDSINIFDYDALKRGLFKIQALHFDLTHDLDEWQMHITFDITRKVDNAKQIAYWDPSINITFQMTGLGENAQFPPYKHDFGPEEYQ